MQFSVINNCPTHIGVFQSNVDYTSEQLGKMIGPKEILKKIAYDYYWHDKLQNDWVNHIHHTTKPYLQLLGFAGPTEHVDIYNIIRVPEFLYIFFIHTANDKAELWYYKIASKYYFNQFDKMTVYQYNIRVNEGSKEHIIGDKNLESGILTIDYFSPGKKIGSQVVDWVPDASQPTNTTWQFPIILFVFVLLIIVAIVITAGVMLTQPTQHTQIINQEKYIQNQQEDIRLG